MRFEIVFGEICPPVALGGALKGDNLDLLKPTSKGE